MVTDAVSPLAGTRYGPVTFTTSARGVVATFDGGTAEVSPDGGTLVVEANAPCRWPAVDDASTAERIHLALADLAAAREELCLVSADSAARTVRASLWIDAASPVAVVAAAARTAILLTRVAPAVIAGLTREIAAEQALALGQDQAERVAATGRPTPAPHGTWCVADSAVAVRDLRSTTQIAGSMQPGATYEVRGEAHGWVHVAGHGVEGWVPASSRPPVRDVNGTVRPRARRPERPPPARGPTGAWPLRRSAAGIRRARRTCAGTWCRR